MMMQIKKTIIFLTLSLLLQSNFIYAGECNFIRLLKNKSPGTNVLQSKCSKENTLSISDQLSIAAGGRIWLASGDKEDVIKQQVICQNRSSNSILLQISDLQMPWISTTGMKNCNSWVKNRLFCDIATDQKFFCIAAELKAPPKKNTQQERTTSVSMRNLTVPLENKELQLSLSPEENYIKSAINMMQAEVNLCRKLYNSQASIEMYWTIEAPNKVIELPLLTEEHSNLGGCVKDVVTHYQYPQTDKTISFTHEF